MSLRVLQSLGLVTIQDAGRPGFMHEGLARGGALVPELLTNANRRVQNPDDAAALEVGGRVTLRAEGPLTVATDATRARTLIAGETLTVASCQHRVTYVAFRGGLDAPLMLGSRSTQVSAGLGRILRAGDMLAIGDAPIVIAALPHLRWTGPIGLLPGPDLDAFAPDVLARLTSAPYVVQPSSNRVGTRLLGPRLPRREGVERSRPMVRGALEVPRDGQPIALGPEHPTTGGYPIVAVVRTADQGRLFSAPAGSAVEFFVV
jgi:allophanate hydrolase subunit 2